MRDILNFVYQGLRRTVRALAAKAGQYFRAGGRGEAFADINARHGNEPGVAFYTHISDQFGPFHTKVIAATASEAPHVLDGLLYHQTGLQIEEHYTDTGGVTDHVFGLCHLFGFRFAPRIRDLKEGAPQGLCAKQR